MRLSVELLTAGESRLRAPRRWATFAGMGLALLVVSGFPCVVLARGAYTASLALFAVPSLVLGWALWRGGTRASTWRALAQAWALLVPMGVALNLAFADDFFRYPNAAAVTGWSVTAFDLTGPDASQPIPVEEFAFYALGFLAMLLLYALADAWLVPGARPGRAAPARFGRFSEVVVPPSALAGAAWLMADGGAPSYFTYLCAVPLPVTLWLWPRVRARLNPAALLVTLGVLVPVSALWEAALAVPRGWWGYQAAAMLGPTALGVPVEAIAVWVLAPVTTAVVFEALRWRGTRS
ncbi:MAG: hypothetical protein INH41_18650 [Myxococcaceae bacterium]|jgi:hypothetical protein|nr:hypothetical protein [Myxococcaceae bacterium]MCA3014408.1 hypothetical protein [Myxococcaceae bacterium]